jgi:hypothetical protein
MEWKHVGIFVASFAVGCALLYLSPIEHKTVLVFPTPFTTKKLQYKDKTGACYHFNSTEVPCTNSAKSIPASV